LIHEKKIFLFQTLLITHYMFPESEKKIRSMIHDP